MKIHITDIFWDVIDNGTGMSTNLPKNLVIDPKKIMAFENNKIQTYGGVWVPITNLDVQEEVSEAISDWLSNTYGFCHLGFFFEIKK